MGGFTCLQGLLLKNSIWSQILCVKQETCMSSVEYFYYKKGSHNAKNHSGYLISLVSTETPSVKTIWDKDLAESKGSDLSQWLSLRLV